MAKQENKNIQVKNTAITERIKTFDDACRELGENHPFVRTYEGYAKNISEENKNDVDVLAFLKLRIIAAALNEGWEPKFTKDECRYFPYFRFYTQEEYNRKDEEWKQKHPFLLLGGSASDGAYCGLVCSDSGGAWALACTALGSRIAVKSEELAIYFGKQFIEIWKYFVV